MAGFTQQLLTASVWVIRTCRVATVSLGFGGLLVGVALLAVIWRVERAPLISRIKKSSSERVRGSPTDAQLGTYRVWELRW